MTPRSPDDPAAMAFLDARFGSSFRSVGMPVDPTDASAGQGWLQAVRDTAGWSVLSVEAKGTGDAARRDQRIVLRDVGLIDAVKHIHGWESLRRDRGEMPAPDASATALGFRHIDMFLAREGLVLDENGEPQRLHASGEFVAAPGNFAEADIARAARNALPAGAVVADAPVPAPSTDSGDGPFRAFDGQDAATGDLRPGDALHARLWIAQRLGTDSAEAISGLAAAERLSHVHSPADLAQIYIRALAVDAPEAAGVARDMGASVAAFGALPDAHQRAAFPDDTVERLALPENRGDVELLLQEGLPPGSPVVQRLMHEAARIGSIGTVDMLAPLVPKPWLENEKLTYLAIERPAVLQSLMREGMLQGNVRNNFAVHAMCRRTDDASLRVALAEGLKLPGGKDLLDHAIHYGAEDNVLAMIEDGALERLSIGHDRSNMMVSAAAKGMDRATARMLELYPDMPKDVVGESLYRGAVSGNMPLTLQRLLETERNHPAVAQYVLTDGAPEVVDTMLSPLRRAFGAGVQRLGYMEKAALFKPERADAVRKVMEANDVAATLLLERMTEDRRGCAVKTAVSMGDPALLERVLLYGRRIDPADTGNQGTALHELARQDDPRLAAVLLPTVAPEHLDATDHLGETAAMRAASQGNSAVLQQLKDAGADMSLADNRGWTVRDHARAFDKDRPAVARAAEAVAEVVTAPARSFSRFNLFRRR